MFMRRSKPSVSCSSLDPPAQMGVESREGHSSNPIALLKTPFLWSRMYQWIKRKSTGDNKFSKQKQIRDFTAILSLDQSIECRSPSPVVSGDHPGSGTRDPGDRDQSLGLCAGDTLDGHRWTRWKKNVVPSDILRWLLNPSEPWRYLA